MSATSSVITTSGFLPMAASNGYKPILSYQVVNDYREFLANEAQMIELRKRFERYNGPVVNVGGVR